MRHVLWIQILMILGGILGHDPVPTSSVALTATADAAEATTEPVIELKLKDGGTLRGVVRMVEPSVYIIQTETEMAEITGSELRNYLVIPATEDSNDALFRIETAAESSERIIRFETFEEIAPNGDVDYWSHTQTTNKSAKVLTYIQWGAKEKELARFRTMTAFDKYGNRLAHRIEPRPNSDLYNVIVDLAVPVAPGEKVDMSLRYVNEGYVKRQGDVFRYAFAGDFPEARIYHGKVVLPAGAEIDSVEPKPWLQFEHDGRTVVVWHHFFPKYEVSPLSVTYRLK